MKKIYLPLITLFFCSQLFAQIKSPCEKEASRLNQMVNVLLDQNERLKKENLYLKGEVAAENKNLSKPVAKASAITKLTRQEAAKEIEDNMVKVDAGVFTMGCANEQDADCYYWEKPSHAIKISSFYMNKFDVTQKEWIAVMDSNPGYTPCSDCPVENISWQETILFINRLNNLSGKHYRLPTEAEWEYAARGGSKSGGYKYSGSNDAFLVSWHDKNSDKQTHPVGQLQPNELGLYDMSGNVWQWCADWFEADYYKNGTADNPKGPFGDSYKVCRGGSWWSEAKDGRVSNRDRYPIDGRDDDVGFRLARD